MEDIKCIFCNKSSDKIVIEEKGYKGRKCSQCGLIYISPRPSLAEISNMYHHDQAHSSAETHIPRSFTKRLHAKHDLRIIKKFIKNKNGSMLEIGMGAGYFLDEAKKEGFEVYGIDLNKTQVDFVRAKFGIPCEESSIDVSLFGGKKFDIIYFSNVIAHLYDPISDFQKINDTWKGSIVR
jgi:2-polyprenyl-3-methyl-5-hydroxy-6-metoxy-1,4-benzoquinol methylase